MTTSPYSSPPWEKGTLIRATRQHLVNVAAHHEALIYETVHVQAGDMALVEDLYQDLIAPAHGGAICEVTLYEVSLLRLGKRATLDRWFAALGWEQVR
jgi:hypothetical protein